MQMRREGWEPPADPTGEIVLPKDFVLPRSAFHAFRGYTFAVARARGDSTELLDVVAPRREWDNLRGEVLDPHHAIKAGWFWRLVAGSKRGADARYDVLRRVNMTPTGRGEATWKDAKQWLFGTQHRGDAALSEALRIVLS